MKRVTLYVVDDERLPIQYFKRLVRENEDRWELVGESTNGREAYEEILRLHPDIIFADISMPVMDGLQLAEKLLKKEPSLKIVLLTAYRDFDYAQKGIQLGVSSYLLKHELNGELLDQVIQKICKGTREEQEKSYWYAKKTLKEFLREGAKRSVSLEYQAEAFCLMDLSAEKGFPLFETEQEELVCQPKEIEQAAYPKEVVCQSLLQMEPHRWTALILLRQAIASRSELSCTLSLTADRLREAFSRQGLTVSVLISRVVSDFSALTQVYRELHRCRRYIFFQKKEPVIFQSALKLPSETGVEPLELIAPITHALEGGNWNHAGVCLREALSAAEQKGTLRQYQSILQAYYYALLRICQEKHLSIDFLEERPFFSHVEDVHKWTEYVLWETIRREQEEEPYSETIRQAIRFIREHYRESFSMAEIAEACRFSERYLRQMFKKELGVTLLDYLTEYRVEQAKKLMARDGIRPGEASAAVGFASAQYFSSVFKKVTGESPSEFCDRLHMPNAPEGESQ